MARKPRSDITLNRLSPAQQAAVAQYAAQHTLLETLQWLKTGSPLRGGALPPLTLSMPALSRWLSGHRLRQQLLFNDQTLQWSLQHSLSGSPHCTPDQLRAAGHRFFTAIAFQRQDAKLWLTSQHLDLARQKLELERKKLDQLLASRQEAGLHALASAFRANPKALKLFQAARNLLLSPTTPSPTPLKPPPRQSPSNQQQN
ncbi:MAG: hypothetical protein ABSF95_19610 [Verrucomicrobiota bacterium]|jgi:hypothetical protein